MNFKEACEELLKGKRLRRKAWPVSTVSDGTVEYWHIWVISDYLKPEYEKFWDGGLVNGWGGSVGAGSDIDNDGMLYKPSIKDAIATDWVIYDYE